MTKLFNYQKPFFAIAAALICLVSPLAYTQDQPPDEAEYVKDSSTEINVKNADIAAIVRIFSKKAKRNYILDERVKGKVSIYLPGKVSSEEAVRILDSVLSLKGFTSVPIGENLWKIIPAQEARQTTIPTVKDGDGRGSPYMVTRIINLKYVNADDVKQLITPLVSSAGLVNAYTGTNSLIAIDSEENIERLMGIIESLDLPFSDREMTLIPVKHADATDLADKINDILGEGKTKDGNDSAMDLVRTRAREQAQGIPPQSGQPPQMGTSALTVAPRAREPKITSDERTNSIIVVADSETTARIKALVSELDSPVDLSGNRYYVYRCQHADAEELADVLSGMGGGGGGSTGSSSNEKAFGGSDSGLGSSGGGLNSGSRQRGNRVGQTQDRLNRQNRTPGRARSEEGSKRSGPASANLGEDVSITADPATNSLIINAGKSDYEKILELLKQLDIKRKQVLVEALLLEVALSDQSDLSTSFITSGGGADGGALGINNSGGDLSALLTNPTAITGFAAAVASAGVVHLPAGQTIPTQTLLIKAAQTNSNTNILSAPNILATDNEEAEIVVGRNVPFISSTAASADNLNNTFNQIDRQDVGITLRIKPQISSSDYVTLNLFTEVSNVIANDKDLGPTTTIRTSETTVITRSGQMIVTGGLLADSVTDLDSGVPFLKDIPVLGHVFRRLGSTQDRTNLIIFITPKIISDQFDARDATVDKRDTVQDAINRREIEPRRDDVLLNDKINTVTEAVIHEGQKPGTIRTPNTSDSATRANLGNLPEITRNSDSHTGSASDSFEVDSAISESGLPSQSKNLESGSNEAIELKVSPKLPSINDKAQKNEAALSTAPNSLSTKMVEPEKIRSAAKYIVAQLHDQLNNDDTLPFKHSKNRLFCLTLPAESSPAARLFFQAGDRYRYETTPSKGVGLRVLGVFSDSGEANSFYPGLPDTWYTLSPHEIMNLGRGPWIKQ